VGGTTQGRRQSGPPVSPRGIDLRLDQEEGVPEIGAGQVRIPEIGPGEVGQPEIGPAQVGGKQVRAPQDGAAEIEGAQVHPDEVRPSPIERRTRGRGSGERSAASKANEYSKSVQKTDYQAMGAEPPIAQFVTTYMLGDDLFDDSFSIDSPAGEFLGECGVGISETIGVGDPKRVTAFEVWIFDKNDIQTVTKVLMSPHAFNDPALRAKLESKGELIELTPGKEVVLETATLQLSATVADSQFGEGPLPPQSFYDRMTLELAIWTKA